MNDDRPNDGDATVMASLRERALRHHDISAALTRRIDRVAFARLGAVAAMVVAIAAAIAEANHRSAFWAAAALALVIFALLVRLSRRLALLRRDADGRARVNEQAALRAERRWSEIDAQPWTWGADVLEPLRTDLDLVGHESLVQVLPTLSAALGAPRLREWLSSIADLGELRDRQAAVRELAGAIDLREAFELSARRARITELQLEAFVEWGLAAPAPWPAWLRAGSIVLPIASIVTIGAAFATHAAAPIAMLSVLLTLLLAGGARRHTRDTVCAAEVGAQLADAYAPLCNTVLRAALDAPRLRLEQTTLRPADASGADDAFRRLQRIAEWAEVRSSPMLHVALQAFLAWDCHIARAVERWRSTHGARLADWFGALAELECLSALGGVAYANPGWSFPDLSSPEPLRIRAQSLGHPLLPPATRIANDVEIGPPGTVLLISGSNMSGKSTLLRAIGLNVLLARIGAPVCAAAMECPPVRLITSLRVQDSLANGISYFMAEALRLRDIVVAAEASGATGRPHVLYLVDEILRGTNSEERAVAARIVVHRLLQTSAIGVITTHDLGIFGVPELASHIRHAHFAERFTGEGHDERLVFDYRLHDGPTTSRNALRLLALIGLGTDTILRSHGSAGNVAME